jgi:hypothetical protein
MSFATTRNHTTMGATSAANEDYERAAYDDQFRGPRQ